MNILYCASEAVPFIKTGGLADVAGSLPIEIKKQGDDIRVVLPLYSKIKEQYGEKLHFEGYYYVDLDYRHQYCGVFSYEHRGTCFYFLDNEFYFHRPRIYGEGDDGERFIFFSKAAVQLPKFIDFKPDIIHANDWHTAMVPIYVSDFRRGDAYYNEIKTVYTIHNLKYQGVFESDIMRLMGLSPFYFNEEGLKYYDAINMMKGAIVYCDFFTTVSGSYALEIKYPYYGEGLHGIVEKHSYKLKGIVNGIDYEEWNPATDPYLEQNYDIDSIELKKQNKTALQRMYDLPQTDKPIVAMVSRLVEMKGIELVRYILDELLATVDMQFVVLGTGEPLYEEMFRYFNWKYPDKCASRIYYANDESHKIYAGADYLLMPSISEPCGISQLIAMRYGTLPIVREVGGLKDTVRSYNEFTKEGNGFSFKNINAHDLLYTIRRAVGFYGEPDLQNIREQAMKEKNDWAHSAAAYRELYQNLKK